MNYFNLNNWSDDFIRKREIERFEKIKHLLFKHLNTSINLKEITKKTCYSATDLANYTYCPASYIIPRKYDTPKIENEKVLVGEEFHKKII